MKKLFILLLVVACIAMVASIADARTRGGDPPPPPPPIEDPPPPPPPPDQDPPAVDPPAASLFDVISLEQPFLILKWGQQPEFDNPWGLDESSSVNVVAADDWMCMNGQPITDIHWWGSYISDFSVDQFRISIFSDIPAGGDIAPIPSHPGTRLAEYVFNFDQTQESFFDTDAFDQSVFYYRVDLPEPFVQTQGTIYWLSIEALNPEATTPFWGWHTAEQNLTSSHLDDAVQMFGYDEATGTYGQFLTLEYEPAGAPGFSLDLAFELSTIPEPATIIMIGGALVGLAAVARKKLIAR